jgi:MiaB/RimO family radical SAM methylthiotransferase
VLSNASGLKPSTRGRTVVTGCWATSDPAEAASLPGVDAVITHHQDVAGQLERLLEQWSDSPYAPASLETMSREHSPGQLRDDGWMTSAGTAANFIANDNRHSPGQSVKKKLIGTHALPLLGEHQTGRQRALLKVQDGCDAHCSYCIIPRLRPALWSKPVDDAVAEARRLVESGHREIVLTGIFLGAYGQPTALRRRQDSEGQPMRELVSALCTRVPGLARLRFSSLEPGDLSLGLIQLLKSYPQVVPHFHLPLQSGSDQLLRRMNRQYSRDDFLRMIGHVNQAFDRPAITTDIIVGFPGETEAEFQRTLEVADRAKFIHIHAFSFSPRPGTAAARWNDDFVRGPLVNERIRILTERADRFSLDFRRTFIGQRVEVLVEQTDPFRNSADQLKSVANDAPINTAAIKYGRCQRYFDVHFDDPCAQPGDLIEVRVDRVTTSRTIGSRIA